MGRGRRSLSSVLGAIRRCAELNGLRGPTRRQKKRHGASQIARQAQKEDIHPAPRD
jgi:hypothetical protein